MTNLFSKLRGRKSAERPDGRATLSRTTELMEYLRDCPFEPRATFGDSLLISAASAARYR